MSDSFEMLVDVDVVLDDASQACEAIVKWLRDRDLIEGELNEACVLGGLGFCPGKAVSTAYRLGERECAFWELITCSVEPRSGRDFNEMAFGDWFSCPSCQSRINASDAAFYDAAANAVGEWLSDSGPATAACPKCASRTSITMWHCEPPLAFGNLAFRFWNWPPLDLPAWQIDIPGELAKVTGHRLVRTYGRI